MTRSSLFPAALIAVLALGITVDILDEAPADGAAPQTPIWETISSPQFADPLFDVDPAILAAMEAARTAAEPTKHLIAKRGRAPKMATPK